MILNTQNRENFRCFLENRTRRGKHRRLLVDQRPVHRHRRQHLLKHVANDQRHLQHSLDQLATHPSQRHHHREHQYLNDYRKWRLLQHIKTVEQESSITLSSSSSINRHHHHHRLRKTLAASGTTGTATTKYSDDWYSSDWYSNDW